VTTKGLTLAQVRKLPATTDVATASQALGLGRSTSYDAIRTGEFPVKTISVRGRIRVLTADLIRVLEGGSDAASA
jgi:Helix-turn-helix domain